MPLFKKRRKGTAKRIYAVRYSADQLSRQIFADDSELIVQPLNQSDSLTVMVWNVYKQQRAECLSLLNEQANHSQLVLLQEAQTTPELIKLVTSYYPVADQVPAISLTHHPSGVMTLASTPPVYCCPLQKREPLLGLAKSALVTVYPLSDGRQLMVANIHSINFSLGINIYHQQLNSIIEQVMTHQGPVIMGGDFNAWSRKRLHALYKLIKSCNLKEVKFNQDHRKKVFGNPLDFVFYRNLKVDGAQVLKTQASDHNPLLVKFKL